MESKITATELAKSLSDVLNRVKYQGERFIIERSGEPVATLGPVGPALGTMLSEVAAKLKGLRFPDEDFADDLEAIHAEQRPIGEPPSWDN